MGYGSFVLFCFPEAITPFSSTCSYNTTHWVAFCFCFVLFFQSLHALLLFSYLHCFLGMKTVIVVPSSVGDGHVYTSTVYLPNNCELHNISFNGLSLFELDHFHLLSDKWSTS